MSGRRFRTRLYPTSTTAIAAANRQRAAIRCGTRRTENWQVRFNASVVVSATCGAARRATASAPGCLVRLLASPPGRRHDRRLRPRDLAVTVLSLSPLFLEPSGPGISRSGIGDLDGQSDANCNEKEGEVHDENVDPSDRIHAKPEGRRQKRLWLVADRFVDKSGKLALALPQQLVGLHIVPVSVSETTKNDESHEYGESQRRFGR